MRNRIGIAVLTACALVITSACATGQTAGPTDTGAANQVGATDQAGAANQVGGQGAVEEPKASEQAEIYAAVLRQYLTTSDHSFGPDHRFPVSYVLDTADPRAADPSAPRDGDGTPIPAADQAAILAAIADVGRVEFVADPASVIVETDGCAQVRDGGVLVVLAPPVTVSDHVEVGIHGFVACLGATWFTYVVEHDATSGWRVAGTTGSYAIA